MIYYTIYKVTNEINGKIYIGSHKTKDLNDNYMGSGKYLKYAQEKHGIENFTKEILYVFDTPEQMYAKEAELVNEDFIAESNTYNLKVGGFGGWDYINSNEELVKKRDKYKNKLAGRTSANKALEKKYGSNWKQAISKKGQDRLKITLENNPTFLKDRARPQHGENNPMYGKKHSTFSKQQMSKNTSGKNNPCYGKRWIHCLNEKKSKMIQKDDPLPLGWIEGRKIKF